MEHTLESSLNNEFKMDNSLELSLVNELRNIHIESDPPSDFVCELREKKRTNIEYLLKNGIKFSNCESLKCLIEKAIFCGWDSIIYEILKNREAHQYMIEIAFDQLNYLLIMMSFNYLCHMPHISDNNVTDKHCMYKGYSISENQKMSIIIEKQMKMFNYFMESDIFEREVLNELELSMLEEGIFKVKDRMIIEDVNYITNALVKKFKI